MIPSGNCPLRKELLLDVCMEDGSRRVGIALAEGLFDWGLLGLVPFS
jgi:hypothetical protein